MDNKPRRLLFHLIVTVLVKLVVLVLIWWLFIRDESVDVNAEFMASHLGNPVISQGVRK
jgi:hypothetical protein